jgi:hypothetical protein
MVHFTPDTAFHANRSRHFEKTMDSFDLLVTTKSFELDEYGKRVSGDRIHLTTQGYDPAVHFPRHTHGDRTRSAAFAGLAEPDRELCVATLLGRDIPVRLAGRGWETFLKRWASHPQLTFAGADVFGDDYAGFLSSSWVCLGLLSKRFPELHTTRTFEIPACGGILATESTTETRKFFADSEAIFFDDYPDLADKLSRHLAESSDDHLAEIASAGTQRVTSDGRDYPTILRNVLADERLAL